MVYFFFNDPLCPVWNTIFSYQLWLSFLSWFLPSSFPLWTQLPAPIGHLRKKDSLDYFPNFPPCNIVLERVYLTFSMTTTWTKQVSSFKILLLTTNVLVFFLSLSSEGLLSYNSFAAIKLTFTPCFLSILSLLLTLILMKSRRPYSNFISVCLQTIFCTQLSLLLTYLVKQ